MYRHALGVGWGGILSIGVGKVAETGRFFRSIVMRHFCKKKYPLQLNVGRFDQR